MLSRQIRLSRGLATDTYVVAAPRASDVLAATLCNAYAPTSVESDPFADLIRQLDRIPLHN